MSDILDEIKEDLEKEKFLSLVKKYGRYVVYVSCAILFVVSVVLYMNHRNNVKQQELSKIYYSFLNHIKDGFPEQLAKEEGNIYSNLARIDYAIYLRDQKQYKESLQYLLKAIASSSQDEVSNLAGIHAVFVAMQANLVEENYKIFSNLQTSVKSTAPFADLLIWSLTEMEVSRNQRASAEGLLKKIDHKSAHETIKLLYDIAKDSIAAKTYETK